MKLIIDRFEGEFAVCEIEPQKFVNIPKCIIPNAKENDVINIEIDIDETKKRKEKINKLINKVFEE